jgi:hypothetical protein
MDGEDDGDDDDGIDGGDVEADGDRPGTDFMKSILAENFSDVFSSSEFWTISHPKTADIIRVLRDKNLGFKGILETYKFP